MTFIHPAIDPSQKWGSFHSKMMILKFDNFIRVVIPTANLTKFDWYSFGQVVWFQDFYEADQTVKNKDCDFEKYLNYILDKTLPKDYKIQ